MKTFLAASVAALLFVGSTAQAATSALQQFENRAETQALAKLGAAGVDLTGHSVAVRATVDSDGRLAGVHVVRSSGSRDTDASVETALRKLAVADAPPALIGAAITLNLGGGAAVQSTGR